LNITPPIAVHPTWRPAGWRRPIGGGRLAAGRLAAADWRRPVGGEQFLPYNLSKTKPFRMF